MTQTIEIYSWDATRLLVADGSNWEIVDREPTLSLYRITDAASGGVTVDYYAADAQAALDHYIEIALMSPHSYHQGEDGVNSTIPVYVTDHDGDVVAEDVIDFANQED